VRHPPHPPPCRPIPQRWPTTWSSAPQTGPPSRRSTWPAPPSATCTARMNWPTRPRTRPSGRSASGSDASTAPPPRRLARPLTVARDRPAPRCHRPEHPDRSPRCGGHHARLRFRTPGLRARRAHPGRPRDQARRSTADCAAVQDQPRKDTARSSPSPTAPTPPPTPSPPSPRGSSSAARSLGRCSPESGPATSATSPLATMPSPVCFGTAPSPPASTAPGSPPTPCAPATPPPPRWPRPAHPHRRLVLQP